MEKILAINSEKLFGNLYRREFDGLLPFKGGSKKEFINLWINIKFGNFYNRAEIEYDPENPDIELNNGIYSIPEAGFSYAQPFKNGIFEGTFDGTYQRAYVDNSDRYSARGGLNLLYWIDIENDFLPGTQFDLSGDYGSSDFKLFAKCGEPVLNSAKGTGKPAPCLIEDDKKGEKSK